MPQQALLDLRRMRPIARATLLTCGFSVLIVSPRPLVANRQSSAKHDKVTKATADRGSKALESVAVPGTAAVLAQQPCTLPHVATANKLPSTPVQ